MRKVLYALLLIPLLFVPLQRVNIADLLPVEGVAVYIDEDKVVLETDTEHMGKGDTVQQALDSLKENTSAVVYLDTAKYLLVSENAVSQIDSLRQYLKPTTQVCVCDAKGRVKDIISYLEIHQKLPKLKDWDAENTHTKKIVEK